ncbi:MAG TPA: CTP synthase [Candidatus Paceibacterota bacterium]|nr:CTP synthase [Candidatus Paceibacterota bacterium]
MKHPSYIFVVGGVISGVGKGITSSSIAKILQDRGVRVTALKIDPYVNVDAGTMNPTEHGEVFVLDDGYETDQDMGNYERFLNTSLSSRNYMTTGRVYQAVIANERALKYKGACVQVVPHVPLEVVARIEAAQREANAEVTVIEIGGTIGEYENILFLEAARMMKLRDPDHVAFVMVSYLPTPGSLGEMKTKPTQHSVRTLNASGIQPDIVIARSTLALDEKRKQKISYFCNVSEDHVIAAPDIKSIYDVPLNFERENLSDKLGKILHVKLGAKNGGTKQWVQFTNKIKNAKDTVKIAMVGKYFETGAFVLSDAYLSVIEAVKYSACAYGKRAEIEWVNAGEFEKPARPRGASGAGGNPASVARLLRYDGIIVPGGFGSRGVEGKIAAIRFAREKKIPYFGLCYGMQLAVIEFARHAAGMPSATTRENNPKSDCCIIDIMETQREKMDKQDFGGTMRLGTYPCTLMRGTIAQGAYRKSTIHERHRHRYEVNPKFISQLEVAGLIFSGKSPDGTLMEIAELPKSEHPFFLGTQFHPEFLARPLQPHPLFTEFIKAAIAHAKAKRKK